MTKLFMYFHQILSNPNKEGVIVFSNLRKGEELRQPAVSVETGFELGQLGTTPESTLPSSSHTP